MLQSHTATQEWQSFEMRMRRRRIERCLLRASVAIEAGVLDDAREAIEEVRVLDPNEPGLDRLTAQLADAESSRPIEPQLQAVATPPAGARPALVRPPAAPLPAAVRPPAPAPPAIVRPPAVTLPAEAAPVDARGRHHRFAAAIVLLACAAGGGWWWRSAVGTPAVVQMAVSATRRADPPLTKSGPDPFVGVSQTSVTVPISGESRAVGDFPMATTEAPPANAQPDVRAAAVTEVPAQVDGVENAGNPPSDPSPDSPVGARGDERPALAENRNTVVSPLALAPSVVRPPAVPSPKLEPLTGLPEAAPVSPPVVAGAEGIAAPEAAARSAEAFTALPSPPPADATPTRSDEQAIRATLGRYESAYNRLDASAAASVWPAVNQRALASAFHGLSAQSISLGRCEIRVSGATAHADCEGNARWIPKVGGGTQSAARHWRFDLRNSGGNWVISQATIR